MLQMYIGPLDVTNASTDSNVLKILKYIRTQILSGRYSSSRIFEGCNFLKIQKKIEHSKKKSVAIDSDWEHFIVLIRYVVNR